MPFRGDRMEIYARMRQDAFSVKQPIEQSSYSKTHRDMEQETKKEDY